MKKLIATTLILCFSIVAIAQEKNVTLPERPNRSKYSDYSTKDAGWWCAIQIGISYGDTAILGQLDIVTGYRLSEFLKIGIGVSPRVGLKSIPVYIDVRGNIIPQVDRMHSFFWKVDVGYALNDGIYLSPGLGMQLGGIRHNFLVGANYTLQGFKEVSPKHFAGIYIGYEF